MFNSLPPPNRGVFDRSFEPDRVVGIVCAFSDDATSAAVREVNKKCMEEDEEFQPLHNHILVMARGDRDLAAVALREQLDLSTIRRITREIAFAVQHLHSTGVIHSDLKQLNVLRCEDRKWRLIDLDSSVKCGDAITGRSSHKIMPPEALASGDGGIARVRAMGDDPLAADATFDIWAFGVVLFELVTRQLLFSANGDDSLERFELERLSKWNLGDLADACDSLRAATRAVESRALVLAVTDLVPWCLQPNPRLRPQSMNDVLQHHFFYDGGTLKMSAVHMAAALDDTTELMRLITEGGALIDSTDHLIQKTPLHLAAESLSAGTMKILLDHGASPELADAGQHTPMHSMVLSAADASSCPDDSILEAMFDQLGTSTRSDLTLKDRLGRTPLGLACASPNPTVKKLYSRLHVAVQLETATRGIARQPKDHGARRPSLKMIGHAALITPSMDGVKVVALFIGNAGYEQASHLRNPVNDVNLLAKLLSSIKGAHIIVVCDGTKESMDGGIAQFLKLLGPGVVALFGFAGHGLQVDGINYLVPVDYHNPTGEKWVLKDKAVSLRHIQERMEDSNSLVNVCIVDACRVNLFTSESRALKTGLAAATAPAGTLLAFATAAGAVASDGKGENGLYTEHLVSALLKETLSFDNVLKAVGHNVRKATDDAQKPWMESSLICDFALFDDEHPPPASSIEQLRVDKSSTGDTEPADEHVEVV